MQSNSSLSTTSSNTLTTTQSISTSIVPEVKQLQEVIKQIEKEKVRPANDLVETPTKVRVVELSESLLSTSVQTTTISRQYLGGPSSMKPPPLKKKPYTPKYRLASALAPSTFKKLFLEAHQGQIHIHNKTIDTKYLQSMSCMDVFSVKPAHDEFLYLGIENQKLEVKIIRNYSLKELNLISMIDRCLKNYQEAKKLGIPVARIYNEDTAQKDCCLLQESVFMAINPLNFEQMEEVRALFITSLKEKMIFYLTPKSLRINENAKVILTDFVEDRSDGLEIFIKDALEQWTRAVDECNCHDEEKTQQFLSSFTKELVLYGYDLEWNRQILDRIFVKA